MSDTFFNMPLLWMALSAVLGAGLGAGVIAWRNIRKYRGSSRSFELSRRLQDAELRYETELASRETSHAFFANMSHELRTPFQGLLGMLDLVAESPLNEAQQAYIATAHRSAQHLLGVLNAILDVSSMDSGMFRLTVAPMSIRQVLSDTEALMGVEADQKGLLLSVHCAPDVPDWVAGDALRVRQIVFNLISNALKFTEKGRITVSARRSQSRPGALVLTVQDTGTGMDEATLQQLFTRFFQADSTKQRRTGGTGLGLEISRNLARMMDGDIHVASQVGVGTTFTVLLSLPACKPTVETLMSELAPLEDVEAQAPEAPLNFLVAEDHPINLQYMTHLLHSMGHRVKLCDNGKDALELALNTQFDAILMDYHMPEMNGMEVTRAIRKGPQPYASVNILMLTADVVNDTRQLAREAGVNAFLTKPLGRKDLQRALVACGIYKPGLPRREASASSPKFMMSDYELPMSVEAPSSDALNVEPLLVDWPAVQEIIEVMTHNGLERQMQSVFHPTLGSLPDCINTVTQQSAAKQLKMVHELKGSLSLLGLRALATCCESAQARLKQTPPQLLDQQWVDEIAPIAERTLEELKPHFQLQFQS
jgi:signal transduction histidine kinase/CheY-like chemotaxis protein/HPt (histidine-containing phosphotransfer) domain-containing protein